MRVSGEFIRSMLFTMFFTEIAVEAESDFDLSLLGDSDSVSPLASTLDSLTSVQDGSGPMGLVVSGAVLEIVVEVDCWCPSTIGDSMHATISFTDVATSDRSFSPPAGDCSFPDDPLVGDVTAVRVGIRKLA